jgi:DNA topoisomerase IA
MHTHPPTLTTQHTQGYLSYPRTESTAYPPNTDIHTPLAAQRAHPLWGDYAAALAAGFSRPQGGNNAGDHPPLTPVRCATEAELGGGDAWRIYDYVARHFLASLSPDCVVRKTRASLAAGGESFAAMGVTVVRPGFTAIQHWKVGAACCRRAAVWGERNAGEQCEGQPAVQRALLLLQVQQPAPLPGWPLTLQMPAPRRHLAARRPCRMRPCRP